MKTTKKLIVATAAIAFVAASAYADMNFTFGADTEGFQNVTWRGSNPIGWPGLPGSIQQTHSAGAWQMMMTKEFSFGPGGGAASQQLEMQALANAGNSRIAFDVMVDGNSFPATVSGWFQFNVVGNSDGSAGWSQSENLFTVSGWHNAGDAALLTQHLDLPFSQLGWQPGDTWFQFWTGANSEAPMPVNFYLDNVRVYGVPEPAALSLVGLGLLLLGLRRNRS